MGTRDIKSAINIYDLRARAEAYLPKIAFDMLETGVDDERGLARNRDALAAQVLVPRYMLDVSRRDQSTMLFGQRFSSPFGISPTGAISMFRPFGDMMVASAARDANVPFVMSGHSTASIEELSQVAPEHGWYQMYTALDRPIADDMIRRTIDAGLKTLVLTVDVPVQSNRERNVRNGFSRPLNLSWKTKFDILMHPAWFAGFLRHGKPFFSNWARYAGADADVDTVAAFAASQTMSPITWSDVERFRRLWPRNFVIKGILHPADAVRAAEIGVDGIVVSNHGGRQIDRAPSPLQVLPSIVAAVGDRMTVMFESGVRRGSDIAVALCFGAKFVFAGRPFLYGVSAAGKAGVDRALEIFRRELDVTMAQIGASNIAQLDRSCLLENISKHEPEPAFRTVAARVS